MTRFGNLAERFKPSARAKTHLLAAALLWTVVGLGLTAAGLVWSFGSELPWSLILAAAGIAAGTGLLIGGLQLWKAWRETPGFMVSSK
jgi:hypothetical protein